MTNENNRGGFLKGRRVSVLGAGIGGLTAAIAVALRGADVEVFEQAPEIKEVGAGIQITPNGARVLNALGCADALSLAGVQAMAVTPVDALTGKTLAEFDLSNQTPPYRFFRRSDLVSLLIGRAQELGVTFRFGVHVTSVGIDGVLHWEGGQTDADLCIGADGIHSIARGVTHHAKPPAFTGQVAWRGIVADHDTPPKAQIWMAPGRHVVLYPLSGGALNVVAVQERDSWAAEGWDHPDNPEHLQQAFSDCAPALQKVLSRIEQPRIWGLFRHPVAEQWSKGALAILGDAAHPTLPFLAQGANLAIEDAWVLAAQVDGAADLTSGLRAYQDRRKLRVGRAIAAANANARHYHLRGLKRRSAHFGLKTLGIVAPKLFLRRLSWLYDHDVTQL